MRINPAVLYDLYNEPHDVSWEIWLIGGTIMDKPNTAARRGPPRTYQAVGMQKLLDTAAPRARKMWSLPAVWTGLTIFSGILEGRHFRIPHGAA